MTAPFLGLTARREFWDPEARHYLFLGQWCLRQKNRETWERMDYQVLPYPWDDREALHRDAAYQEKLYEEVLADLAAALDEVHGESHGHRYWRILLGPWLLIYIQNLHERYLCLRQALDLYPDLRTLTLSPASRRIPRHFPDHHLGILEDPYNLQLYSSILEAMGHRFPSRPFSWNWGPGADSGEKPAWRRWLGRFRRRLLRRVWSWAVSGPVLLVDLYLPDKEILSLMAGSGFQARCGAPPDVEELAPGLENHRCHPRRRELGEFLAEKGDPFRRVLAWTLPQHFPLLYLEGYQGLRKWVRGLADRCRTRAVLSGVGFFSNEVFKFLAAAWQEKGVRLAARQHGGAYGSMRYHPCESLEKAAAHEFWSWGWTEPGRPVRPVPNPGLSRVAKAAAFQRLMPQPYLYFVGNAIPRYQNRTWSGPIGPQMLEYLDWEIRFVRALAPEVRASLIMRPFMEDYGWQMRERLRAACPDLHLEPPGRDYYQGLRHARLVVCDMNTTTILEALAANLPTVAFWDAGHWELRPEARPYFRQLQEAGILHHQPEEAAQAASDHWEDSHRWWLSPPVQEARSQFVRRFAWVSPQWRQQWRATLEELAQGIGSTAWLPGTAGSAGVE
jgi:putative transferase (TIGR04331 family)